MSSYCLKCRENTESKNPKVVKTKNRRIILFSKCTRCKSKKSKFIKEQQARGILSNLEGIEIMILSDLPLINTFMPEIHLKQLGFAYSG